MGAHTNEMATIVGTFRIAAWTRAQLLHPLPTALRLIQPFSLTPCSAPHCPSDFIGSPGNRNIWDPTGWLAGWLEWNVSLNHW